MFNLFNKKKKILIVDDDQIVLDSLEFILESENYIPLKAKDPKEFFKLMNKNPDLILMDIHLENIKGEELVEDAQIEDKVIFMSSSLEYKDKHKLFMGKPLRANFVKNTVNNYFKNCS